MLTDSEIEVLVVMPKEIIKKEPAKDPGTKNNSHKYYNLELESTNPKGQFFSAYIRQNIQFIENFSIGLRYQTESRSLGKITLLRYNGPHGEVSRHHDGHYNKPHIHRITAAEIQSGNAQPQEKHREITNTYHTFEEALMTFFKDTKIPNYSDYFPHLGRMTIPLNGH